MTVHIGCKYTGKPQSHADTTTGIYWEALPKIDGSALALQAALLAKPEARRQPLLQRLTALVGTGQ